MKSFLATAGKTVTSVKDFLREASSSNSVKYVSEKGAKHLLYIPYQEVIRKDENGNDVVDKQIIAITAKVHSWNSLDGNYRTTVCLDGVFRKDEDDNMLNDGTCPICDRIADAWEIRKYRIELEEATCTLTGDKRKEHIDAVSKVCTQDRKAKEAVDYIYLLVVKYRLDKGKVVKGEDGLPEYDLKVMKMSNKRVEKLEQQLNNTGSELPGAELAIAYANNEDKRVQVSQSTTSVIFPDKMQTKVNPSLLEKINADVDKFEFETLDKSFPEFKGMTVQAAKEAEDELFAKWDEYKVELKNNKNAKYLEYVTEVQVTQPSLDTPQASIPQGVMPPVGAIGGEIVIPNANEIFDEEDGTITI